MIKRNGSYAADKKENMRGGSGVVVIEHLLTPDELYEKGRLFAKITLQPGCSIGHHVHEGEMESYHIVTGQAEVDDNGDIVTVNTGDTVLTKNGEGHSIKNTGSTTLEFIALILYK